MIRYETPKSVNGFTLVELASVLMIIGLLIGGILRGQELLSNARVAATVQQVKAYEGATTTFREAYGMLPGDLVNPASRISGCTGANNCVAGNADGMVGVPTNRPWGGADNAVITTENFQFWKHLALVHLISGVDPSASVAIFGKSNPATKMGGGFTVIQSLVNPSDQAGFNGLVLRIHNDFLHERIEDDPVATPQQAARIDRKMDDGQPFSGDVRSSQFNTASTSLLDCELSYNEAVTIPECSMYFMVAR